jgi:hypothetical protein
MLNMNRIQGLFLKNLNILLIQNQIRKDPCCRRTKFSVILIIFLIRVSIMNIFPFGLH